MANPRKIAVSALVKVETENSYSNLTLLAVLKNYDLSPADKALASALFYGVLDRRITIDYILSRLIKSPLKKVAPFTLNSLRCAVYQIVYMDKIPESAAVNEAVKAVKASKENRNSGFVNAVLRNFLRNGYKLPDGDSINALSVRYSCPEGIINSLINDYGKENALSFLEESLKPATITVRINTVKTDSINFTDELSRLDIPYENCGLENAIIIKKGINIANNELYLNGFFHVQDSASQTAVSVLAPKPYERMLDMCAAPGGKSFTAAELMENNGEIVSADLYEHRVKLIADSAERLGLDIIKPVVQDATVFNSALGKFDCILCDVPCSGIGVMRRKPEIKYNKDTDDTSLPEIQLTILKNAASYLKSGGRILYSTCTLNRRENENVVKSFLKEYNSFDKVYEHTYFPHIDKTDGFYCALLRLT